MDLPVTADQPPERFVPAEMRGQLVEAEHLARYRWASRLAAGRRVLDAGCGTGYGTMMLAAAAARTATGVDISEAAVGSARETLGDAGELHVADIAALPFEDASFDLVVCFEAIEHVPDPEAALDELRRVLVPDGLLLVSSPNRREYPAGNPHHVHEYEPEELEQSLLRRFNHARLVRQQAWVVSALLHDEAFAASEMEPLELEVRKVVGRRPGQETFTVALASDVPLADNKDVAVMTSAVELSHWVDLFDDQQRTMARQAEILAHHSELDDERRLLHRRLRDIETELEAVPRLTRELYDATRDRDDARRELVERLAQEKRRGDRAERVARDLQGSVSWRMTAPLRRFRR